MKYYPTYKDSNINWAMSIPATWKVQKIKYGLLFRQGGAWGTDPADNEFDCPCIRVADFDYAHLCVLDREYTVRNYSTAQIEKLTLSYGDLLIEKSGGGETTPVGRVVIYDKKSPALYANFLEALRVKENQSSSFYKYIFSTLFSIGINRLYFNQTTGIQNLNVGRYIGEKIPIPPLEQQNSIALYLDEKTAEIDDLISQKTMLVNLLREKRTSAISTAVTKGIDSTAEMQDSGTEWLGYIPSHWKVVPAKALFFQSKETRHETDVQLTASQKYGIISQEDYMELQNYKIVLADKGLENWKHVEPNDFIISLRSFQGGLEISYIPGCITWHYIVLKPKAGVEPEYFKWLFKSPRYVQALQRTANFIRDGQDLRFSNFVQVPLPLIPMDEQKEIAEYLNKETARIDSIIADVTEQIEKLREYRQSIISEVVTGKVAVE